MRLTILSLSLLMWCWLILLPTEMSLGQENPLTKEIDAILDKYEQKKWEAEKEAAAKLSKLQDELELELGRLSEKLNKGGKLDDAIVVRDVIRKMRRLRPLRILYHPTSKDYLLAATDETIQEATAKGYAVQNTFVGFVLSEPNEQTVPLMTLFWKHGDDFFNTATKEGIATGQFEYDNLRIEGHIYPNRLPGTSPLYLYWNGKDNATMLDVKDPSFFANGYRKVRLEGWVLKSDK